MNPTITVQQEQVLPLEAVAMARSMVSLIGLRDHYTASHSARVANHVRAMASQLGLSDKETEIAVFAASMHDVGKIGVPDHILMKPGKLDEEELAWIQKYPEWGWMTLRNLEGFEQAALLVRHQHERIDGAGYPDRLGGEDIPLGSRLIMVADSYDALTTDRPYRQAVSQAEALAELIRCSGRQFDPEVVDAFRMQIERQIENELAVRSVPILRCAI